MNLGVLEGRYYLCLVNPLHPAALEAPAFHTLGCPWNPVVPADLGYQSLVGLELPESLAVPACLVPLGNPGLPETLTPLDSPVDLAPPGILDTPADHQDPGTPDILGNLVSPDTLVPLETRSSCR